MANSSGVHLKAEALKTAGEVFNELPACLAAPCTPELPVWKVLLGVGRGWKWVLPAIVLILYNLLRAHLTWGVGTMRDAEDRSGFSPPYSDYKWLYFEHRVISMMFVVALFSLGWHLWEMLFLTYVILPAGL